MKIISCEKKDFNDVIDIEYEAAKKLYNYKSKIEVKTILKDFLNKSKFFILKDKNNALGYIVVSKDGMIEFIAIKNKYQRLGIGSKLIKFAEKYFKGLKLNKIKLEVLANNLKAINFYKKHGFNAVKKYKKGKRFKLVMSKKI